MTRRSVQVSTCGHCHTKTLLGVDDDTAGIEVRLDHAPIDALGEALAVLNGRKTYDLLGHPSGPRTMKARRAGRIRISHGISYWPVHAEHRCGQPLPTAAAEPQAAGSWDDDPWAAA